MLYFSKLQVVSKIETSPEQVSEWSRQYLLQFYPTKLQVCIANPFCDGAKVGVHPDTISKGIRILGVDIKGDTKTNQSRTDLNSSECSIELYFMLDHRLLLYKDQVCVFYSLYNGKCLEGLFEIVPPSRPPLHFSPKD